jgi:hypothetical protein
MQLTDFPLVTASVDKSLGFGALTFDMRGPTRLAGAGPLDGRVRRLVTQR